MHALGVVAANYNSMEFTLQLLFYFYIGLKSDVPVWLFNHLHNNKNRLDILSRLLSSHEQNPQVADLLAFFVTGYDICAENRNLLMHSLTLKASVSTELSLHKFSRNNPTKTNYIQLTVAQIRAVADEIDSMDDFGVECLLWLRARDLGGEYTFSDGRKERPALPNKPPKPNKLNWSDHPIQTDEPPQGRRAD